MGFFQTIEGKDDSLERSENETSSINVAVESSSLDDDQPWPDNPDVKSSTPTNFELLAKAADQEPPITAAESKIVPPATTTGVFEETDNSEAAIVVVAKENCSEPASTLDMKLVVDIPQPGTADSVTGRLTPDPGQRSVADRSVTSPAPSDDTDVKVGLTKELV